MKTVKKLSLKVIKYSPRFFVGIFIVLLLMTVGSIVAKASCDIVYKPGEVLYVDAGHTITMIVEPDKMEAYQARKIPDRYLPLPTDEGLSNLLKEGVGFHYCGEFRELDDRDLE